MPVENEAAYGVVNDAAYLLRWCAEPEARLIDDTEESHLVLPERLLESYRAAIMQFADRYFPLALQTLAGDNEVFPLEALIPLLVSVGWTGPALDFKLGVLELTGREEVMATARAGGGGRIRRKVFRAFVPALNAALGSLSGVPGVGAIKELKDFIEVVR
jgi:hypothetical protein